ncbi:hypothetical protein, partial [Vreelandella olivaria]|uniref:hypothetical protein n=1 Tax=Vreelandella olivaria TaxID=390919 RepID=UPI00201F0172
TEYQRFGERVQSRISQALARSLTAGFPHADAQERLTAVETATELGKRHGLRSKKQVKLLAKCVMELGATFPERHPEARQILDNMRMAAWRKRDLLEAWLPRGRKRHALLAPYQAAQAHDDNYRPIDDEERP